MNGSPLVNKWKWSPKRDTIMKAQRLRDLLGPIAFEIARSGGYSRSYWGVACNRDLNITKKRREAMRDAIDERIKELRKAKKELE